MRMAFSLLGILVTLGVIIMIMHFVYLPSIQQAASANKSMRPKVQQISGHDVDGEDARKTISLDEESSNGKINSVVVTAIDPFGAMARYFGLQTGDAIVEIAPQGGALMPVKEMSSASEAKDQLLSAYQNSQQIVIVRDGKKMTLPAAATPAVPAAAANNSPAPAKTDS